MATTSKTSQSRGSATGPGGMFGGGKSSSDKGSGARSSGTKGGSGTRGSKGGGASTQKPGAGRNEGRVTQTKLGAAKQQNTASRGTALGKVSQAAKQNVTRQPASPPPKPVGNPPALRGRTWDSVLNTPYNTVFPERAPVTGTAMSFPGRPRPNNRWHSGLDFGVAPGSTVTPVVPGKVIQVAKSPGAYGPTVQVMNTFGTVDRYALHQGQNIPVKVGQPVYAGTPLGVAGPLPGRGKFSHLHYERITPQDRAYDKIVSGMKDGSLARARGGVVGSTSTYRGLHGKGNIQSSTPQWARAMGIDQNESFARGVALRKPGAAVPVSPSQFAGATEPPRQQVASAALGSIPKPRPRPAQAPIPRPVPRPLQSFISGDPRLGMAPGAYPAAPQAPIPRARPPMPGQQMPVGGMSFTPSLPGQMPRSVYSGYGAFSVPERLGPVETYVDPSTGIARNPYDVNRSVKRTDERVPQAPAGQGWTKDQDRILPSAQYSGYGAFNVPREAVTPLGAMPADEQPRLTPERRNPFNIGVEPHKHSAPPTPWQYRNESPPAAPHLGTPSSQTATADDSAPSMWEGADNLTSANFTQDDGQPQDLRQLQRRRDYEKDNLREGARSLFGRVGRAVMGGDFTPYNVAGAGGDSGNRYAGIGGSGYQPPATQPYSPAQLTQLLTAMQAAGATPDEVAYVQSLLNQSMRA